MKSKKLFAILTLVAFLMTLVPAAAFAFAAPTAYSAAASSVSATNTSPGIYDDVDTTEDVDGDVVTTHPEKDSSAKISVLFKNGDGQKLIDKAVEFYVKSSRDAEQGWVDFDNDGYIDGGEQVLHSDVMASSDGEYVIATTDENGKVYVRVGSQITGSFTFKVFNQDGADDGIQIGDSVTVKISAGDGDFSSLELQDEDDNVLGHSLTAGDDFDITAELMDGSNPIEGKTVTFKKSFDDGSYATLGTAVTDEDGIASFYYKVTKAGDYKFKAVAGDSDKETTVYTVVADDPSKIVYKGDAKYATDNANELEWELQDDYGNVVKEGAEMDDAAVSLDIDVTAAPTDSDWVDFSDNIAFDTTDPDTVADSIKFNMDFDKVGKYTVKVKIVGTRISLSTEIEAVDFDSATSLSAKLLDDEGGDEIPAIYYSDADGAHDGYLQVKKVNKDGVAITVDPSDLKFATSDNSAVTVGEDGFLTVEDDEFAGTVNITVSYGDDSVVGTFPVAVTGKPAGIKATPVVDGKDASVTVQFIDKNGKDTNRLGLDNTYELILPSGISSSSVDNFDVNGEASFDLSAEEYGTYNITIMADAGLSKTFSVNFAAPVVVPPVIGAKTVTMFIGATGYVQDGVAKVTDVAPFIKDGRTFVAVRAIADAFGATATWNEATQTVTLTRSDRTITIVIGSPTITIVKDGVTSTVTADVPAFIVNGRTVLPFRAVAEAFGATVAYDAATGAVTFNQ